MHQMGFLMSTQDFSNSKLLMDIIFIILNAEDSNLR